MRIALQNARFGMTDGARKAFTRLARKEKPMTNRRLLAALIICHMLVLWLVTTGTAQTSPRAMANSYLDRGNAFAAQGKWERAIADFDLAIAFDPKFARAFYNRAVARYRQGSPAQALDDFDRAIELDLRLTEAYVDRGGVRFLLGDLDGAISDGNRAIELNPRLAAAWNNRGLARGLKEDHAGALADFTDQSSSTRVTLRSITTAVWPGSIFA